MTILYEYTAGSAPLIWQGIILFVCAGLLLCVAVIGFIMDRKWNIGHSCACILCALGVFVGIVALQDTRHREIKVLVDDAIPWKEIDSKYKLVKHEGEIYTFAIKESTGTTAVTDAL